MTYANCPLAWNGCHKLTYEYLDDGTIIIRCIFCGEKIK